MPKRKREDDDDDYVEFCNGLRRTSRDGVGDNSYVYSSSRRFKRPRINPNFYKPATVRYRYVNPDESIFREIESLITNNSIVIDEIIEVKNSVLEKAYNEKKAQKRFQYGSKLKETLLFHGTKESNLNSICKFNFDWRLNGSNKGHKFGKGVCFSTNAKYASSYSDPHTYYKVMVVAKVLIANVCQGHHDMSIPPQGFDTSQKNNGIVLVKYEDNEFLPAYVMHYHFRDRYEDGYGQSYHNHGHYYHNDYDYHQDRYHYDHYNKYGSEMFYNSPYSEDKRYNEVFYNSQDSSDYQQSDFSNDEFQDNVSYFSFF